MSKEGVGPWLCFHCDELFVDPRAAALHFGKTMFDKPACQVSVEEFREMESRVQSYADEDTELHRQLASIRSELSLAVRRAEEEGYERGLRDAQRYPAELGLMKIPGDKDGETISEDKGHSARGRCEGD